MKLHIVDYRKVWYGVSITLAILSVAALIVWPLRLGIDFKGGSLLDVSFANPPAVADLRGTIEGAGYSEASIQQSGEREFIVRTKELNEEEHQTLLAKFRETHGETEELRFDSIGPVIGKELAKTAALGVLVSLILIAFYISWAFRGSDDFISSKKTALLTLVKTGHDVLISVGAYAVLGHFFGYEADTAFVAAALTILGYSINDGVVVLDRTRENLKNKISPYIDEVVDRSINQTLARSINTSVTVFLALLAVFLFGGETTQPFALTLLIGVAVGTYSSIFIASPLLVTWSGKK